MVSRSMPPDANSGSCDSKDGHTSMHSKRLNDVERLTSAITKVSP